MEQTEEPLDNPSYGGQMNTDLDGMKVQVKALQDKLASGAGARSPVVQSVAFHMTQPQDRLTVAQTSPALAGAGQSATSLPQ